MFSLPRPLWSLFAGLACFGASRSAAAWIESSVLSDAVTVEIDREGQAIVTHDLWMKIRGGPLKGTELDGIDADAEPLPEAVVTKMMSSGGAEQSKPLLLSRGDDDTLRLEVDDSLGLRNGTYAFRFKYRTDMRQRSRIGLRGSWAELAWIGPRYRAGLDVAKVTFKLAHASIAPRLPEIDPSMDELAQGELPTAAMLSTLRRGADTDELELVRPHVAKGEPVLWRVWAAPATFPWLATPKSERTSATVEQSKLPRAPLGKGVPLVLAALFALVSAFLVQLKHRAVEANAIEQGCRARPLIAVSVHLRAVATGVLLAVAVLSAVRFDAPTMAAVALVSALACMTYRRPTWPRILRGPGRWLPVHSNEAFERPAFAVQGRFLDASTAAGKSVLGMWLALVLAVAVLLFRTQPYLAVLAVMGSVVAFPLTLTGRVSELPSAVARQARRDLERILRQFARDATIRVHPIGRFADGESRPDEIRLKLSTATMPVGVLGLEVAVHGIAGASQPCLLLRLRDSDGLCATYEREGTLVRGRTPQERVFVYAPSVAARTRVVARAKQILQLTGGASGRNVATAMPYRSTSAATKPATPARKRPAGREAPRRGEPHPDSQGVA